MLSGLVSKCFCCSDRITFILEGARVDGELVWGCGMG